MGGGESLDRTNLSFRLLNEIISEVVECCSSSKYMDELFVPEVQKTCTTLFLLISRLKVTNNVIQCFSASKYQVRQVKQIKIGQTRFVTQSEN